MSLLTHTTLFFCPVFVFPVRVRLGEGMMWMLCAFDSVSGSSRLISREGVMVIYLCFGFILLILAAVVGSRVKCHQRTFIENIHDTKILQ